MTRTTFAALAFAALCTPLFAHDYKVGDLTIDHPFAFETPTTAMTGGGFLTITNMGETDDRLLAVEADYPRVEIHTTVMEDSIARMQQVEAVDLPAGETVTLAPGGMHIMFMGLRGTPFVAGESFDATLIFEQAGRLDVTFSIEERTADTMGGMSHGAHGMGN